MSVFAHSFDTVITLVFTSRSHFLSKLSVSLVVNISDIMLLIFLMKKIEKKT